MSLFSNYFKKVLNEDIGMMSGGTGGVFGAGGDTGGMFPGGSDSYAPGDARIPDILGNKKKRKTKKRKRKRKKSKRNKQESIDIQRRNLKNTL